MVKIELLSRTEAKIRISLKGTLDERASLEDLIYSETGIGMRMLSISSYAAEDQTRASMPAGLGDELSRTMSVSTPGQSVLTLEIDCRSIKRINSQGVRQWIRCFERLRRRGVILKFHHLSPMLVEQINLISNFCAIQEIVSIQLPYFCSDCRTEHTRGVNVSTLDSSQVSIPMSADCPRCKHESSAEFDDFVSEYLRFLGRDAQKRTEIEVTRTCLTRRFVAPAPKRAAV